MQEEGLVLSQLGVLDFVDARREALPPLGSGWGGEGWENWRWSKLELVCEIKN